MSYSSDVKKELALTCPDSECCARSELYAALLTAGSVGMTGAARYMLSITSVHSGVLRHFFSLIKRFYGDAGEIHVTKHSRLGGSVAYKLAVPEETTRDILSSLGMLTQSGAYSPIAAIDPGLLKYTCCKKSFVKAAFLLAGTMSDPLKEYHVEFVLQSGNAAGLLCDLLKYFEINAKNTCRKGKEVVYFNGSDAVSDALTLMGGSKAMMEIENIRIAKDVKNRVNRQMNCDSSNLSRVMETAEKQLRDIDYIEGRIGINRLPATLAALAKARKEYPELSLTELGRTLTPEVGKSGVNARMRRIAAIADELRKEDT